MTGLGWFVRTVRPGDSHLAAAEWNGYGPVRRSAPQKSRSGR
ncbi:hypothetical protein FHR81_002464 [Actinoalloteichus hoggarensis]|uniref:Uncharacterized protein n=1 Tax=Actinoalloteichus hoggarensis TaxID=1470176 RepID=A0A221VX72_9PSEU|nr:hypothetical protein [Actinoalloteichus hoggarensis]ASO18067.1 hypothetical protein AHOG_02015 [Actinoalloteichus hoggarensis]MBB5921424.1 hypothetical protein [Actinoalloteichus hoggarensis]